VPKERYKEVRSCQVIVITALAYRVIRDYTTHHGHPLWELIFLFEWVAFWGKIVNFHFLGVNLSWLLALGRSPLREKSSRGQAWERKDARDHEEGWRPSLEESTCSESRTCLYISHSVVVPPS
jgi:hypothetical protein